MSNWKPTSGLLLAESVVQTLLTDAATRGHFITDPTLRHRWVQTVADALDGFRPQAVSTSEPEFLEERDDSNDLSLQEAHSRVQAMTRAREDVMNEPKSNGIAEVFVDAPTAAPKKRSRGRPKLSAAEKKKRKAAKDAAETAGAAAT